MRGNFNKIEEEIKTFEKRVLSGFVCYVEKVKNEKSKMQFPGIRLVEQTEQYFVASSLSFYKKEKNE